VVPGGPPRPYVGSLEGTRRSRANREDSLTRQSLYSDAVYHESLERIDRLSPDSVPVWGTMTAAQMLAHCADVQEVGNGSRELEGTPFLVRLFGPLIRRMVVSEKPYPRGARTHPQYEQRELRDFESEKARLLERLAAFRATEHDAPARHPIFGELNHEERGWAAYKHLDHHLRQFGL